MLSRTVVLLTCRVNLLMKGVTPAVLAVIVIVVSSAWLAPTRWENIIKTALTAINERVFIRRLFLRGFLLNARVQENFNETHFPHTSICPNGGVPHETSNGDRRCR